MSTRNRRQFVWSLTMGFVVVSTGGVLRWVETTSADALRQKTPNGDWLETVPPGSLPSFAAKGGTKVQEAYRYAVANEAALQYIPCFCGCKNIGHRHNAACYIAERLPGGHVTFTSHAAT
jgi:hypothetical protein